MDKLVQINSHVRLRGEGFEKSFLLVESSQCDPGEGRISTVSPLGKAMLGRSENETIEIDSPQGRKISYRIIDIEP